MTLNVYSIYDIRAETFNAPFFMQRDGMALRAFQDVANDRNTTVGKHPGDFKLVHIGVFDDGNGVLSAVEHRSLGFASDMLARES